MEFEIARAIDDCQMHVRKLHLGQGSLKGAIGDHIASGDDDHVDRFFGLVDERADRRQRVAGMNSGVEHGHVIGEAGRRGEVDVVEGWARGGRHRDFGVGIGSGGERGPTEAANAQGTPTSASRSRGGSGVVAQADRRHLATQEQQLVHRHAHRSVSSSLARLADQESVERPRLLMSDTPPSGNSSGKLKGRGRLTVAERSFASRAFAAEVEDHLSCSSAMRVFAEAEHRRFELHRHDRLFEGRSSAVRRNAPAST